MSRKVMAARGITHAMPPPLPFRPTNLRPALHPSLRTRPCRILSAPHPHHQMLIDGAFGVVCSVASALAGRHGPCHSRATATPPPSPSAPRALMRGRTSDGARARGGGEGRGGGRTPAPPHPPPEDTPARRQPAWQLHLARSLPPIGRPTHPPTMRMRHASGVGGCFKITPVALCFIHILGDNILEYGSR